MPVTKTAKRALRSSNAKKDVNSIIKTNLDKAIRAAKKSKTAKSIQLVTSLADRAAKKNVIHKNKASRIKSSATKLLKPASVAKPKGKTSRKK